MSLWHNIYYIEPSTAVFYYTDRWIKNTTCRKNRQTEHTEKKQRIQLTETIPWWIVGYNNKLGARTLGARSRGSKISHTGDILVTNKRVNTEPIQLETPKVLAPTCYDIKRSIREKSSLCNWFLCFFSVCSLCLFFLQMVTLIHNFDFLHFLIHP